MASKHRLYYSIESGSISLEEIKEHLRDIHLKFRDVRLYKDGRTGVIIFQKRDDKESALAALSSLTIGGVMPRFTEQDPRSGATSEMKAPVSGHLTENHSNHAAGTCDKTMTRFFNPYHFVDTSGFTPRYPVIPHDSFTGHCGRIKAKIEFLTPGFIPDPEKRYYVISDETLMREDEEATRPACLHSAICRWLKQKNIKDSDLPLNVRFDPDCPEWDSSRPQKHIWAEDDTGSATKSAQSGQIIKEGGRCCIKTPESCRWAHKVMEFFQIKGKYTIPSTSLKGMLRSSVETLSNSCFTGFEEKDAGGHLFHRLDVQDDNHELRGLKPVILKKMDNGKWGYLVVNQAKLLSPHLYNRIGAPGENALGAYLNRSGGYYEKISVVGKQDSNPDKCSGLHAYELPPNKGKNYRGDIKNIASESEILKTGFAITEIKNVPLTHAENNYNKTFPYIGSVGKIPELWAIVRKLKIPKKTSGGYFCSYKIKEISLSICSLKTRLSDFNDPGKNPDSNNPMVTYAISEIRIKTAFDIDTKTQHRAFFIFGKENFDEAVTLKFNKSPKKFGAEEERIIGQFNTILGQRKKNAEKISNDSQGINKTLAADMPEEVFDGMLAYYHQSNKYLACTAVPQKPYRQSPLDILRGMDKLPCNRLDKLCPACQMFGTVIGENVRDATSGRRSAGYKGKITLSRGTLSNTLSGRPNSVTIKPLSAPKPTFYPFYVTGNRKKRRSHQPGFKDYDSNEIRIGRKAYLHHDSGKLDYQTDRKRNLNATIQPVPRKTAFEFEIDFENLTNYELGLLLYTLNMRYKGEKAGHHLGMGKSLGLGSCTLDVTKVQLFDMKKRYIGLDEDGWKAPLGDDGRDRFEKAYQYVQGAADSEYSPRLDKVNALDILGSPDLPGDAVTEREYFSRPYIRDFHILKSININTKMKTDLPVHFAGGADTEGFRWYQKVRKDGGEGSGQRLFEPIDLETDAMSKKDLSIHALTP